MAFKFIIKKEAEYKILIDSFWAFFALKINPKPLGVKKLQSRHVCVCVSARVFWHGEVVSCQSHKSGPHCSFRWIIICVHTQIHTSFDPFHTCKKWTFWCYSKKCFLQMWKKSACNAQQTCRLCCQVQCTPFISSKQSAVLHVGRDPELNKWMV